jgi:TRAP-type C4-dicarboxylate transport system permease small subunit
MLTQILAIFDMVNRPLIRAQKFIVILFGTFMAVAMTWTIISRLVFKNSLLGLEEIVLISAIWFYMIGAALACSERSHIKVDILTMFIKDQRILSLIQVLISVIVLAVTVVICRLSFELIEWAIVKKTALPATRIPSFVPQAAFAISTVAFLFYFVRDLLKDIVGLTNAFAARSKQER